MQFRQVLAASAVLLLAAISGAHAEGTAPALMPGDVAVQTVDGRVRFTLLLDGRFVGLTAAKDWTVAEMSPGTLISKATFHLPDPAAAPDQITNVHLFLYAGDPKPYVAAIRERLIKDGATENTHGEWTVLDAGDGRRARLEAYEVVAGVTVHVTMGWPLLAAHPAGYDNRMAATFHAFLDSVRGATGIYQPHPGEVRMTY